jgi:glycosyltransferase involved in cell wall biosynthesis
LKILYATYEGVPLAKGGPFVKIHEMKKLLQEAGHRVELFNMWESVDALNKFDIVHLVGSNFSIYGLARSLKQRNIKFLVEPVFFSRHSAAFINTVSVIDKSIRKLFPGSWLDYGFIRDICNWSELILPNTGAEKELISKGFNIPEKKFKVIHNGVSERFLNADSGLFIKKYGIKDFILFVGHIGPKRKNVLALVKALEKINHPAVIIGKMLDMGESREVKRLVSNNKNITLIEEIPNDSLLLESAYAACDTFVLPSQFETPGIAALEAALAGAKIVITKYGGTKEYFKDMAVYVSPASVESISDGIQLSLNSGMSDKLKEFVKNNFLWRKIAGKTIDVYKEYSGVK